MTPAAALEIAKSQFTPLYLSEPVLQAILTRALGAYQDKAGVIKTVKTVEEETEVDTPEDLLSVIFANDDNSRYHEVNQEDETLTVDTDDESVAPYTIHYFVNLRDYDPDTDLPAGIVGTLIDYIAALIDIPNTERARAVALSTGRQTELPTNSEMLDRKAVIEAYMEDNRAIIPMLSVF